MIVRHTRKTGFGEYVKKSKKYLLKTFDIKYLIMVLFAGCLERQRKMHLKNQIEEDSRVE